MTHQQVSRRTWLISFVVLLSMVAISLSVGLVNAQPEDQLPDLEATSIRFEGNNEIGVTVFYVVTNVGDAPSPEFQIGLYDHVPQAGETPRESVWSQALNPGETYSSSTTFPAGTAMVSVYADYPGAVVESSEANNVFTRNTPRIYRIRLPLFLRSIITPPNELPNLTVKATTWNEYAATTVIADVALNRPVGQSFLAIAYWRNSDGVDTELSRSWIELDPRGVLRWPLPVTPTGTVGVNVKVDVTGVIVERNETDNEKYCDDHTCVWYW